MSLSVKNMLGGGGMKIANGVKKKYLAETEIDANSFVATNGIGTTIYNTYYKLIDIVDGHPFICDHSSTTSLSFRLATFGNSNTSVSTLVYNLPTAQGVSFSNVDAIKLDSNYRFAVICSNTNTGASSASNTISFLVLEVEINPSNYEIAVNKYLEHAYNSTTRISFETGVYDIAKGETDLDVLVLVNRRIYNGADGTGNYYSCQSYNFNGAITEKIYSSNKGNSYNSKGTTAGFISCNGDNLSPCNYVYMIGYGDGGQYTTAEHLINTTTITGTVVRKDNSYDHCPYSPSGSYRTNTPYLIDEDTLKRYIIYRSSNTIASGGGNVVLCSIDKTTNAFTVIASMKCYYAVAKIDNNYFATHASNTQDGAIDVYRVDPTNTSPFTLVKSWTNMEIFGSTTSPAYYKACWDRKTNRAYFIGYDSYRWYPAVVEIDNAYAPFGSGSAYYSSSLSWDYESPITSLGYLNFYKGRAFFKLTETVVMPTSITINGISVSKGNVGDVVEVYVLDK